MRRALAALLHEQYVYGAWHDVFGRSLRALRRRRRTLLRQPMHRIENDLPRRLPSLRDAGGAMLCGEQL